LLQPLNQNNVLGVPRQLAGRAFHYNLFLGKNLKKVFSLQSLTQLEVKTKKH
jgi:hypothetical protein